MSRPIRVTKQIADAIDRERLPGETPSDTIRRIAIKAGIPLGAKRSKPEPKEKR